MDIARKAMAGSLESCDCLVMVIPADSLSIRLESSVEKRYGNHIRALVRETLRNHAVASGSITVTDRGALDYCIKARVVSAVRRGTSC